MLEKLLVLSEAAWIHLLIQLTTLPAQLPALHMPSASTAALPVQSVKLQAVAARVLLVLHTAGLSTAALPFLSARLKAVVEVLLQGSSLHVLQGPRLHVGEGSSLLLLQLTQRRASLAAGGAPSQSDSAASLPIWAPPHSPLHAPVTSWSANLDGLHDSGDADPKPNLSTLGLVQLSAPQLAVCATFVWLPW